MNSKRGRRGNRKNIQNVENIISIQNMAIFTLVQAPVKSDLHRVRFRYEYLSGQNLEIDF